MCRPVLLFYHSASFYLVLLQFVYGNCYPVHMSDVSSARVVKTLGGDGTTFHADVRRDGHYTCSGMVYAKMFYGGDGVLFRGDSIPPQIEYCM